ncbi:MAG: hypothetical protein ACRD22_12225 [Terriglobia bacterium]
MPGEHVAIAVVVTSAVREEFELLKYSFELFHNDHYEWFVRCDAASMNRLASYPNVHCTVFTPMGDRRPAFSLSEFRHILAEKMNALGDAWSNNCWDAVLFLDADLVITSSFLDRVLGLQADVILSPSYFPPYLEHTICQYGHFNAGFLLTRTPDFTDWWRNEFCTHTGYSDQTTLDFADKHFRVTTLGTSANIGGWRRTGIVTFDNIPRDCMFLHVHLFQPVSTIYGLFQRLYALHCLEFLCRSNIPKHRVLYDEILERDRLGWYRAAMAVSL